MADPPCPPLPFEAPVPDDPAAPLDLRSLPARPGVLVLEDATARAVAVAASADVRRAARARLAPPATTDAPSRRAALRPLTRRVVATTVGSAFEADWAWLQVARRRLPHAAAAMLDRWRAWFVHCDPDATHPRFVRTSLPGAGAAARTGVHLGPVRDRDAARQYIELLWSLFDLCREHDLLVQAPRATACAYKEMGRCPAPCDGTVTMDDYRRQVEAAIRFAATPLDAWRAATEAAMTAASAALDFERAGRLRRRLDEAAAAARPGLAHVDRLERFRFLGVFASDRPDHARLFLVRHGWIAPFADVPVPGPGRLDPALRDVLDRAAVALDAGGPPDLAAAAAENIGLVAWHLHRATPGRGASRRGGFVPLRRLRAAPRDAVALMRRIEGPEVPEERLGESAEAPPGP
ncbi:MAG: hypothetical protein ACYTG1_07825 [Planctomycetota bacterium]